MRLQPRPGAPRARAGACARGRTSRPARASLTAIDVKKQADGLVVTLQGNGPLKHEYFLVEGKSLVVDIAGAGNKVWPRRQKIDDTWVSQIRIGEHEQPKKFVRVVFDLKKVGEHRVDSVDDRIVVSLRRPGAGCRRPRPRAAAQVVR